MEQSLLLGNFKISLLSHQVSDRYEYKFTSRLNTKVYLYEITFEDPEYKFQDNYKVIDVHRKDDNIFIALVKTDNVPYIIGKSRGIIMAYCNSSNATILNSFVNLTGTITNAITFTDSMIRYRDGVVRITGKRIKTNNFTKSETTVPKLKGDYIDNNISISGLKIKDVKFSGDRTIVFWEDKTKTIVKMQNEEVVYDPEKAIMAAYMKKVLTILSHCENSKNCSMDKIFDKYLTKYDIQEIETGLQKVKQRKAKKEISNNKSNEKEDLLSADDEDEEYKDNTP